MIEVAYNGKHGVETYQICFTEDLSYFTQDTSMYGSEAPFSIKHLMQQYIDDNKEE